MNILLVDDEMPALKELEAAVREAAGEADIRCFSKASEAIEFAEEKKIDIAFLDINMRFMDGITMAKKLTEFYPKCNIIFCTGYSEYAMDALNTYCSGYLLKPISTEKVKAALDHLRYPVDSEKKRVELRCFGNFDVLVDGVPVAFKYKKSRELLAYLTDRGGAEATTQEIIVAIFEENKTSYFSNIRLDLINTLADLGCADIVETAYGRMRINRDKVECDYFDYLDGCTALFHGEYMSQYSFAESTCATLTDMK